MTTFSPSTVGRVATRMSSMRPAAAALREMRPSCGFRRSAMSSFASTFRRVVTPGVIRFGIRCTSWSTPSIAEADGERVLLRLEVDVGGAVLGRLEDDRVDEPDERRVGDAVVDLEVVRLLFLGDPQLLVDLLEDGAGAERLGCARHPAQLDEDVLARGDAEVERVARREPELVDPVQVARIGDGDPQRAVVERVRDRDDALEDVQRDLLGRVLVDARRARGRRAAPDSGRRASARSPRAARRPRRRSPARASPGRPALGPSPACRPGRDRSPRAGRRRARPSRSRPCRS